jgi:Carboxypeptidase regulatory-like domain
VSETEVIRHQVAICGAVFDREGEPATGVPVVVTDAAGATSERTSTRLDGTYYFLDLPDGKYIVTASLPGAEVRQPAVVSRNDKGDIAIAEVDLKMAGSQ